MFRLEIGPVTYRNNYENASFVADIKALKAKGGGDCPELTFSGILNALEEAPFSGSPLYVFTDASAKDNNLVDHAIAVAQRLDVTINFFVTGRKKRDTGNCSGCRNFELSGWPHNHAAKFLHVKKHLKFLHI